MYEALGMISLFGTTVSAAAPWFLIGIPAAAALLVYIFRRKGIGSRQIIPTLFLLKRLPPYSPARRRFVPPLQFWIELCILCFLSLAAAGILATETGKRVAVVIDTSKSMGTLHASGETRLSTATRLATSDLASAAPTTRFTVFEASDLLTRRSAPFVSIAGALSAVRSLEQSYAEDRLASLVAALTNTREYDSVWIYTDKTVENQTPSESMRVVTVPFDIHTLSNLWIHSVALQTSTQGDYLETTVSLSSPNNISADIVATCGKPNGSETFKLAPVTTPLASKAPTRVLLGPINSPWTYCAVRALPNSAVITDALSLDNEAWIVNNSSSNTVLLHSALSPSDLGLTAISRLPITAAKPDASSTAANTIFHRQSPPSVPRESALVVFPSVGPLPWKGGSVGPQNKGGIEITRWDESHPLLQYVKPTMITIPTASALECPESSTAIMFSTKGPLVCAGEEAGSRFVVTGFELFPFDGLKNPTLSVFTLNVFKWLFQSGTRAVGGHALGVFTPPSDVSEIHELAPNPHKIESSGAHSITVSHPSVLTFSRPQNIANGVELEAFNSFSDAESDSSRSVSFVLPDTQGPTKPRAPQSTPLQTILAAIALLILAVDVIRRIFQRSRWGAL